MLVDVQCFQQADVCFVLDSSGSICGLSAQETCTDWAALLSFVNTVIGAFTVGERGTHVGVVTFSDDATLAFPLNHYYDQEELRGVVASLRHVGGQTNTGKALHVARTGCFNPNNGARRGVPNIAIVVTDGLPTVAGFSVDTEAALLKQNAAVLAVGVGGRVEKELLRDISSLPQAENVNYFTTPDFASLSNIISALVVETCDASVNERLQRIVEGIIAHACAAHVLDDVKCDVTE